MANSLLVEYQNTIDDWYKPDVDATGAGDWGILTNIDSMVEATHFNYSVPGSWNDADMMTVCMCVLSPFHGVPRSGFVACAELGPTPHPARRQRTERHVLYGLVCQGGSGGGGGGGGGLR